MDKKALLKAVDSLCKDFEHYRHHIYEKEEKKLEQRLNEHVEEFGKDNLAFHAQNWFLGVYRNTLLIEECSKNLSGGNVTNFKKIYPNGNIRHSLDDEAVAKRLNVKKQTVRINKRAIFKEIIEILDV